MNIWYMAKFSIKIATFVNSGENKKLVMYYKPIMLLL